MRRHQREQHDDEEDLEEYDSETDESVSTIRTARSGGIDSEAQLSFQVATCKTSAFNSQVCSKIRFGVWRGEGDSSQVFPKHSTTKPCLLRVAEDNNETNPGKAESSHFSRLRDKSSHRPPARGSSQQVEQQDKVDQQGQEKPQGGGEDQPGRRSRERRSNDRGQSQAAARLAAPSQC
ncbi:hypothetical protein Bbelb_362210 [Branchiostoma belcheri]|nr:hypothetical protein Bbelb_362210 [Branchiostoma belcheri]